MHSHIKLFTMAQPAWLKWLIKMEMLKYVRLNLSEGKTAALDVYLAEVMQISPWTVSKVISFAIQHLRYKVGGGVQIVSIDEEMTLPGTSYRLYDVVKLINYGNLEVKGNGILTDALQYLEHNISRVLARKVM